MAKIEGAHDAPGGEFASRRSFLKLASTAMAAVGGAGSLASLLSGQSTPGKKRTVVVAGHPWVYAAPLPEFDITPVLEQVLAMGEGVTDFAAVGAELHRIGYSGDMAIELAHERNFTRTRPLRESLKMSREYVRRTMGY